MQQHPFDIELIPNNARIYLSCENTQLYFDVETTTDDLIQGFIQEEFLEGAIDFGVQGTVHPLKKGGIIALEGNIAHDLTAKEDSVVRLTLSKFDKAERVAKVVEDSLK